MLLKLGRLCGTFLTEVVAVGVAVDVCSVVGAGFALLFKDLDCIPRWRSSSARANFAPSSSSSADI